MTDIKFKSIDDFDLKGKKVILRADINSSIDLKKNCIRKDPRIKALLPTLKALKDSAVVLIAHQARPGKKDFTSLKLHAEKLNEYLGNVSFIEDIFGEKAIEAIKALEPGKILVLNNIRMWDPENKNGTIKDAENTELIKTLSPLFDYYINDAFGAGHRSQASLIGWPTLISGPLVKKELVMVDKLLNPGHPSIMLVGGAKADDKFKALKFNLENGKIDKVCVCGLTAIMMYMVKGVKFHPIDEKFVGKYAEELKSEIQEVLEKYPNNVVLPVDFAVIENGKRKEYTIDEISQVNLSVGDIGSKTIELFGDIIINAKSVVANGPPGIFENELFTKGTFKLVEAMAKATENGAYTVIGGGEMGTAAEMSGVSEKISMISTGGGALLKIISGKKVPLLEALESKAPK